MVTQLGQPVNYSVCSEMHEVWVVKVRCHGKVDTRRCKQYSPRVSNHILNFLIHDVPWGFLWWRLGCVVFIIPQNVGYEWKLPHLMSWIKKIPATQVYVSLVPAYTFFFFSFSSKHNTSICNYFDNIWLTHNMTSHFKNHLISYTTLYVPSGLPSATCNWIIMLTPQM